MEIGGSCGFNYSGEGIRYFSVVYFGAVFEEVCGFCDYWFCCEGVFLEKVKVLC